MVQDTKYSLELHLQRIDERMKRLNIEQFSVSGAGTDLEDEKAVTKQCLRVCEDARSYIESLSVRESYLLQGTPEHATAEDNSFEAQRRTRQALDGNQVNFTETIQHLRRRLESLVQEDDSPEKESERSRLQADIDTSRQCLDVCKMASEVSRQKVYKVGEVISEGGSDQVVVNTLSDLFDVRKALSKDKSAQLVGSMTPENLNNLTEKRYGSRFGPFAVSHHSDLAETGGTTTSSSAAFEEQKSGNKLPVAPRIGGNHEQSPGPRSRQNRPSPNEIRKRQMEGSMDQE